VLHRRSTEGSSGEAFNRSALLVPVALVGLAVDDRVLVGAPIRLKPLKVALSLVLYGLTPAWMLSLLRRGRRWGARMGTVVAVADATRR
jgi:hypothetical protein